MATTSELIFTIFDLVYIIDYGYLYKTLTSGAELFTRPMTSLLLYCLFAVIGGVNNMNIHLTPLNPLFPESIISATLPMGTKCQ